MYELQARVTSHYTKGQPKAWRTVAQDRNISVLQRMIPPQEKEIFRIVEVRIPERQPRKDIVKNGFHERLRAILNEQGLTGFNAAFKCDIPPQKMYAYLKGIYRPRISTAEKIALGLCVPLEYLVGEK